MAVNPFPTGSLRQRALLAVLMILLAVSLKGASCQVQVDGTAPYTRPEMFHSVKAPLYTLPPIDNKRILSQELLSQNSGSFHPYRFGESIPFPLTIEKDGEWHTHPSGTMRFWRAMISSPGAYSLSLFFDQFYLPPHGELYIVGANSTLGAFTGRINNKDTGDFSTMPMSGDSLILEYFEVNVGPADSLPAWAVEQKVLLSLQAVVHGFRMGSELFSQSGRCNVDVACPEGSRWRDQINAVGLIFTDLGRRLCTGTMLNNTNQDGRQLFLTAYHCIYADTTNYVVGFNYQHDACVSGGTHSNKVPVAQTVHGLRRLRMWKQSDYAILEVIENIPDSYNVYYAGWSRANEAPHDVAGIHHPNGDYKKISRFYGQTIHSSWGVLYNQYHYTIPGWSIGVTESGSSGSALFDHRGLVVGHLHGGTSSCDFRNGMDIYGKLAIDWIAPNDPSNELGPVLDPANTGVVELSGGYFQGKAKSRTAPHAAVLASRGSAPNWEMIDQTSRGGSPRLKN